MSNRLLALCTVAKYPQPGMSTEWTTYFKEQSAAAALCSLGARQG
jgi:hypothetical protein